METLENVVKEDNLEPMVRQVKEAFLVLLAFQV